MAESPAGTWLGDVTPASIGAAKLGIQAVGVNRGAAPPRAPCRSLARRCRLRDGGYGCPLGVGGDPARVTPEGALSVTEGSALHAPRPSRPRDPHARPGPPVHPARGGGLAVPSGS